MKLINKNVRVFGLSASKKLTTEVCNELEIPEGIVEKTSFADGEIILRSLTSVRNRDVVIIQSTAKKVNDNIMELLLFIDALKRASARTIFVICPYFGYARQDRKLLPRQPISAKLIANLIQTAGANRFTSFDLHASQIQGFFDIPVDDLQGWLELLNHFKFKRSPVIVSPDYGAIRKARSVASLINCPVVVLDKRRPEPNKSEITHVLGSSYVKDAHCLIIDDMIDTGGTIIKSVGAIKKHGAAYVDIATTHPVFSGNAVEALNKSALDAIYFTNSISHEREFPAKFFKVSVAKFLAETINALTSSNSLSAIVSSRQEKIKEKHYYKF